MEWWEFLYLLNAFCVWMSARVAMHCFEHDNKFWGWFNVGASAFNAAVVANYFL